MIVAWNRNIYFVLQLIEPILEHNECSSEHNVGT